LHPFQILDALAPVKSKRRGRREQPPSLTEATAGGPGA
jgi:hypothetical protein